MHCRDSLVRGLKGVSRTIQQAVLGALVTVALTAAAAGQANPSLTPDQLQALQQRLGGGGNSASSTIEPTVAPRETLLQPTATGITSATSQLEQILSMRAGVRLRLFGYDQFGMGRAVTLPQVGAIQDDYILGVGDEVVLTLRGHENVEYRTTVDRDGNVTFPKLNPQSAAGLTFGRFRQQLLGTIRQAYVSTDGFVTIGRVRQISVLVGGEVGSPGVRTLTGLSTVMDAVFASGGVKKTGSLRSIRVERGGRQFTVDLYGVLIGNVRSKNAALADGDKIIVPPIGAAVALSGEARRPGIYELPAGRNAISLSEAKALAGGTTVPGAYSISLLRTMPDGTRQYVDVTNAASTPIRDGEVLVFKSSVNISTNQVRLQGAVRTPGFYALGKYRMLHDVLASADALAPDAYMLFGIVDRVDPTTMQRTFLPFSPVRVVKGSENMALLSNDTIRILTMSGMRKLLDAILLKEQLALEEDVNQKTSQPGDRVSDPNLLDKRGRIGQGNAGPRNGFGDDRTTSAMGARPGQQQAVQGGAAMTGGDAGNNPVYGNNPGYGNNAPDSNNAPYGNNPAYGNNPPYGNAPYRNNPPYGSNAPYGNNAPNGSSPPYGSNTFGNGGYGDYPGDANPVGDEDPNSGLAGLTLSDGTSFGKGLGDSRVSILGAVHYPGWYLVAPGTTLADALQMIGGLTYDADLKRFELTSTSFDNMGGTSSTERSVHAGTNEELARIVLQPFDRVEFRRVYSDKATGTVKVSGEVRYPGVFPILRTEKLSSVLQRAGGTTEVGYPEGAVFTRTSVAADQRDQNTRIANDLRSQLLSYLTKARRNEAQRMDTDTINSLQLLIDRVTSTPVVGRVSVVADLQALQQHPEFDTLLEPGDSIVIPKKPSTVLVVGEVVRPGAVRFEGSRSTDTYVDRAGGTTEMADTSRIVVVLPDGSVTTDSGSWLDFGFNNKIPAGSTIYVPRKLETYQGYELISDSIQIFSQLATAAAALAVLSKQ